MNTCSNENVHGRTQISWKLENVNIFLFIPNETRHYSTTKCTKELQRVLQITRGTKLTGHKLPQSM